MILYFKAIASVALIAAIVGFAVPMAVSSTMTLLVLCGFGLLALLPVALFIIWREDLDELKTKVDAWLDADEEDLDAR